MSDDVSGRKHGTINGPLTLAAATLPVTMPEMDGTSMAYSLTQAAEAAKVQRSTVFKWIKAGKVSAAKAEDGTYRIQPAELHRFLDSVAKETPAQTTPKQADITPSADTETALELVSLRSQIDALKQILEMERQRVEEARKREEDLKAERDRWAAQAERLALAPPTPVNVTVPDSRGWWPWRRSA
jgi:excisionase family DNA binding protein